METILENFAYLLQLYFRPKRALSDVIDNGSWIFGAILVLLVSFAFQFGVSSRLDKVYSVPRFDFETYQSQTLSESPDEDSEEAQYAAAYANYQKALRERQKLPIVGDYGLWFFSFNSTNFLSFLMALAVFYVPTTILLLTLFEPVGSFGVVLRRDYGVLLACTLMSWAASHIPLALAGVLLKNQTIDARILLLFWVASNLWFGILMIFALRTVFGASYPSAIATVALSWISIGLGARIFGYISPFLFSPFLLFYAFAYFRGEASNLSNSFRQKQNFRRFLSNAALNPRDADARLQLGLIYKQRRQTGEAVRYFEEALKIDSQEIDANYEMGKIAREKGEFEKALEYFRVVIEQNEKHAQSEIWREIGATYLDAKAYREAREFLETFVERRAFDAEGLYYFGQTLKALGENAKAQEMFERCLEAVQTSPDYRRGQQRKWGKLAQKQLA